MKQSQPSNVSSDVEPAPTATPDADVSLPGPGHDASVELFVVAAYEAHSAELYAFLARSTRDRGVAEDLLREAYARLTTEVRDGRSPREVRAWLYRTASTLVVEHSVGQGSTLGRLGRLGRREHETPIQPSTGAGIPPGERTTELDRVLEGLSTDARVALLLSSEGFTGAEIATAIGRSTTATRTLLGLARTRVRVRRELFAQEAR